MPEDNDQNLNPGQSDYNRKFDFDPKNDTKNEDQNYSDNISKTAQDLNNAEENPNTEYINNYTGEDKKQNNNRPIMILKKKGPITALIMTLFFGGFSILSLSPMVLLNFKEVLQNAFDFQNASMTVRTNKLLLSKTTSGVCTSKLKIMCKYASMSEKQVSNFKKAGIEVVADAEASKTLTNRTIVKELKYNGKTISPSQMASEVSSNPEFRNALKNAYNPKFAGFADSYWKKAASKLGISKAAVDISGQTDEERLSKVQKEVNTDPNKEYDVESSTKSSDGENDISENDMKNAVNSIEEATEDGTESAAKKLIQATEGTISTSVNVIKATGVADTACQAYGAVKAVSLAAKVKRAAQLAAYAMIYLNVADQIKAGVAKPEDVTYLSNNLTAQTKSADGSMKSATDSFGYKFAAYGEVGVMSGSAMRFMAGGGLTGKLSNLLAQINDATGGTPNKTCHFLANPLVQLGSLALGVLGWLGAETVVLGAADVAKVVGIAAFSIAMYELPSLIGDIAAGVLVDKTTIGEDAGDAVTSGAIGIMGTTAKYGGNAPLTADQAVKYTALGKSINNSENSNIAKNQFDMTDSSSFMGKLVASIVPYISKASSLTSAISSISSMPAKSLANIISTNSYAESASAYSMCSDIEYSDIGIATDPYCNVIYGIDTDALEISPTDVNNELLTADYYDATAAKNTDLPQIDEESGDPINNYADFVDECINRTEPLGSTENGNTNGSECIFGNTYKSTKHTLNASTFSINNKYYYLHYIDQRINKGMDGEDSALNAAIDSGYNTDLSFYNATEKSNSSSNNMIANIFKFFNLGWNN